MFNRNEWQKQHRLKHGNIFTRVYERTKKGKLVRTYRNMTSRILGVQKKKEHLYTGLPILDKNVFYHWSLSDEVFNQLFSVWAESGYDRKLSPSIDRKDPELGYTLDNIRWVTHSENSRLGGIARQQYRKLTNG